MSTKPAASHQVIARRSAQVSAKTVNNNLTPLRGVFKTAVDDGLLEHSPLRNIRNQRHQKPLPDRFKPTISTTYVVTPTGLEPVFSP